MHAVMRRIGVAQLDTVNVFSRSHYMPFFSRLGAYDTALFDKLAFAETSGYTEYWAHVAAVIPRDDWALWRFRMDDYARRYGENHPWFEANSATVQWVRDELRHRGPSRPADIEQDVAQGKRGPWWDWSATKRALEVLFLRGEVAIAGRRGFERRYALAEHVIPAEVLAREIPRDEAIRELVRRAAKSFGVATTADLADYYRLSVAETRTAARDLADAGELGEVSVQGWGRGGTDGSAWLHRDARTPRRISATALLTPFDPVVWFRDRASRLFDFDYRIEIYTPAPQRTFGYYSLPVLVDDDIVGRVDLKADRARSRLLVQSAWWEHGSHSEHAGRVAEELRLAARWQGLETVSTSGWGSATDDIAAALATAEAHAHRH